VQYQVVFRLSQVSRTPHGLVRNGQVSRTRARLARPA
jgi:hypothetical protein